MAEGWVPVVMDNADPGTILRYYTSGYAAPGGADPVAAGLLAERDGDFYLNVPALDRAAVGASLEAAAADGVIDWDELEPFLQQTYYAARHLPPIVDSLRAETHYGGDGWFEVEIDGVMTTARRRNYVPYAALRHALRHYHERGEQLIYPKGTVIVSEHRVADAVKETAIMRKRDDGYWDFAVYGEDGRPAASTHTPPRPLKAPTQCVGCHFGSRLFEPEKSFPAQARPGPYGPRAYFVGESLRDAEVVSFFKEHQKRSDTVLGLYNTLFVTSLRDERAQGTIADADATLLEKLGL